MITESDGCLDIYDGSYHALTIKPTDAECTQLSFNIPDYPDQSFKINMGDVPSFIGYLTANSMKLPAVDDSSSIQESYVIKVGYGMLEAGSISFDLESFSITTDYNKAVMFSRSETASLVCKTIEGFNKDVGETTVMKVVLINDSE